MFFQNLNNGFDADNALNNLDTHIAEFNKISKYPIENKELIIELIKCLGVL